MWFADFHVIFMQFLRSKNICLIIAAELEKDYAFSVPSTVFFIFPLFAIFLLFSPYIQEKLPIICFLYKWFLRFWKRPFFAKKSSSVKSDIIGHWLCAGTERIMLRSKSASYRLHSFKTVESESIDVKPFLKRTNLLKMYFSSLFSQFHKLPQKWGWWFL